MISRSFLLKLDKAWFLQMQCFFLLLSFISSYYSCFLFISFTFSIYIVFYICFFFFSHFPFLLVQTFPFSLLFFLSSLLLYQVSCYLALTFLLFPSMWFFTSLILLGLPCISLFLLWDVFLWRKNIFYFNIVHFLWRNTIP